MATTVLYIDDEAINLMLFEVIFGSKYTVYIAETAQDGFDKLRNIPEIQIVLCDMSMPDTSGIDFIRSAKIEFPQKSYYIMTGYTVTDELQDAIESGLISKYLHKPFDIAEIETIISD